MSEQTTEATGENTESTQETEGQTEQTSFTQADVERIVAKRIGDVRPMKAAVKELAEIKESQKTEAQKSAERLAAAEKDVADARNESLRYKIAAEFKLTEKQAAALAHVSSEDGMREVAEQLAASESDRKKHGNFVAREGTTPPKPSDDPMREFTQRLFAPGE